MFEPSQDATFTGYAIVSAEGFIADGDGVMPDSLRFDADWAYFQAALDEADVALMGRHTHEAAPNIKRRRRVVVSRSVRGLIQENTHTWWANPDQIISEAVFSALPAPNRHVAVVGGTRVFDWVRSGPGFSAFHLSVARNVRLGGGRPVFKGAHNLSEMTSLIKEHGLKLERRVWLDRPAGLELLVYAAPDPGSS
ncbi:MAG: hypothetical protein ACR2Q4_07060 [Geminicoccaceae bacterium]